MYRAPPSCVAASCGGVALVVAANGSFQADEALAPHLRAHGIVPWAAQPPASTPTPIARMGRAAVIAALETHGACPPFPRSLAVLRDRLRSAVARTDKLNNSSRG